MRRFALMIVFAVAVTCVLGSPTWSAAQGKINVQALMAKRVPILLEFGRGWCIPCKQMKPILEDMAKLYGTAAIVSTVDMDANRDLVTHYNIKMMPTQVFLMPDGREVFRNIGVLPREQIMQVFAKMGVSPPGSTVPPPAAPQQGAAPKLPPIIPESVR
jgi:thioredoxin-like negative regulator of GroEL